GITNMTPPVVAGKTVTYKGADGMTNYAWTVSYNGATPLPINTNYQSVDISIPKITGDVTVYLTITDSNGCSSSCSINETINPPSDCIVSLNPPTCPGTQQTNQLGVAPSSGATIKWSIDTNTTCATIVGADNQTNVVVTSTNCCNYILHVAIINSDGST